MIFDNKTKKYGIACVTPKKSDENSKIEIKNKNKNDLNVDGKIILIAPQNFCKLVTVSI